MKGSMCWFALIVFIIPPSSSIPASMFDSFYSILDSLGGTKSGTVNSTSGVATTSTSQTPSSTSSPSTTRNPLLTNNALVYSTKPPATDGSCEEYVQRYLQEAISDLKLLTTNFTALLNKLEEIRVMITSAELKANNLTVGIRLQFENYLKIIDLALSEAMKKAPNCAVKGEASKAELVVEVNKKIELALKTLVSFQDFKSKVVTITYRLIANSIDATVTKMQNCGKNIKVDKFTWRIVISCINNVTNNFQNYLNIESNDIDVFASEVKKQKTVILSNLTVTFSKIQLEAENRSKLIAEEIMKCIKQTPSNSSCLESNNKSVSLMVKQVQLALDKFETDLIKVKEYAINYANNTQSKIDAAIRPLVIAINATLSALPNVNLTKQQKYLETLISEAKLKSNVTMVTEIIKYLNDIFETNGEYSLLSAEFREKVEQLSQIDFNMRCKRETVSDMEFCSCVEAIYKNFTDSLKGINSTINKLNDEVTNLTSIIDANINNNLTHILNTIFNISNSAAIDIYNDNNITDNQIIEYALVSKYNVTPILDVVTQLYNLGKDLEKKRNAGSSDGNYSIITAGSAIYDIVGPGRVICPKISNDERLKKVRQLVSDTITYVYTKYPKENSVTVQKLLQQADDVNSTLFNQIALLNADRLKQVCQQGPPGDKKKLFEFYQCLDNEVKKFGVYFVDEKDKVQNYVSVAQDEVKQDLDEIKKWTTTYVLPEATDIVQQLKNESESFYSECNATVEKLINYSLSVAKSYYNYFESNITNTHADVISLVNSILSKNYSSYTISPQLGTASQPVVNAISKCVPSNASKETVDEYRLALAYMVGNATEDFRKVIANFSTQSLSYKEMAAIIVKKREEIFKNHTFSYLNNVCYKPSSPFPLTDLVSCTTPTTYRNTLLVSNNTLTSLLAIKKDLVHFDSDYEQIIQDAAESILKEFTLSAAYFAYRICTLSNQQVPPEVLAEVQRDRCLQGVTTNQYYCIITT